MPDLTPRDLSLAEVHAMLSALALEPQDGEDLAEITHRINAINSAVLALEHPDLDAQEPLTMFPDDAPLP